MAAARRVAASRSAVAFAKVGKGVFDIERDVVGNGDNGVD